MQEYEDRQLLWEQHEVELERTIAKFERQQEEVMDAARRVCVVCVKMIFYFRYLLH